MKSSLRARAAVASLVTTAALGVWSTPAQAAAPCPVGYVCLVSATNTVSLVRAGATGTFLPPLIVREVVNHTTLNYCVIGAISFGLPPGADVVRVDSVSRVVPSTVCLS